ncbi:MAG: hypothetical protein BGO05_27865 [Rhizobiales bacterium 63-7]|nr:MAG: hypothetical protein BGO05_27865 [Rhizobiales bacterium 63-7]
MTEGPRLIGRSAAAAYLGISPSTFSNWVAAGKMPQPILGARKWDKKAIDARLDEISGLGQPVLTTQVLPEDEFQRWQAQQEERDKHKPIHRLDAREERVLRFMIAHPECATVDVIPQAGEATMEKLRKVGVVRAGAKDHRGRREWFVSDEGRAEIDRTDTWVNWQFR